MKIRLKNSKKHTILYTSNIWDIMQEILKRERKIDRNKEHFWTISLNNRFQILDIELVSLGSLSSSIVTPTEVLSVPLQKRATAVVLVHNNPAGELTASEPIKDLTDQLIQACKLMRTPVFDHVIITEASFYSFRDTGLLAELEKSEKYVLPYELKARYRKEMLAVLKAERQQSSAKIQQSLEKGIRKGRKEGKEEGLQLGEEKGLKKGRKEGIEQGIQQGRAEGIQEGAKQREVAIAKQLLKDGEAIEKIVRWTGLGEEQLKQLTP